MIKRYSFRTTVFLVLTCLTIGCDKSRDKPLAATGGGEIGSLQPPEISSVQLNAPSSSDGAMFHKMENSATGIEFENTLLPKNIINYLLNGSGVCAGDYDQDGLVDFYAVCKDGPNKLFRQVSSWRFEDATLKVGNVGGGDYWGTGASFADVNNDGFLDLYVCNQDGPNLLYMNKADGSFQEESSKYGVNDSGPTMMCSFADYDNDGDLDLYLVNDRLFKIGQDGKELNVITINGERKTHPDFVDEYYFLNGKIQEAGKKDILLRNDGHKFVDVTAIANIGGYDMGLSATWWDFDHDGFQDLYVSNDSKSPDHLYKNLGNGEFEDVIANAVGHTAWFSMGADFADLNNDGLLDFVSADMSSSTHYKQKTTMGEMGNSGWFLTMGRPRQFMRNTCFINSGTTRFWEAANLTGLDSTDWTWAVKLNDYDCDGLVDAFFTNGISKNVNDSDIQRIYDGLRKDGKAAEAEEYFASVPALEERNLFYRNNGNLSFENVADKWGADEAGVSHGCVVCDVDRDGDLDLIVNSMNDSLGVYRNDSPSNSRILIRLVGTQSNKFGVGSRLKVTTDAGTFVRELSLARGYMSADEPIVHFGLGNASKIKKLIVEWPSGILQEFENLDVNQLYTITEQGTRRARDRTEDSMTVETGFVDITEQIGLEFSHNELPFDDFEHQPLLPNKLSQLGPGIAWGDVNGDGHFDCYVCGARGQIGTMQLRIPGSSEFELVRGPWASQTSHEELSAVFLDFDSDGDQDLYVVNGGYEAAADSEFHSDVLYVNDGSANFSLAEEDILPDIRSSGSCVCAADYDRDGDLDLFVGTRMISRRWPLPASSTLLRNDNGKFVDATKDVAPVLHDIGLVTSAIWSDADNDGWPDLFVTLEWGNVKIFKNVDGTLVDKTNDAGLSDELGWWNSIASGDIDNDGDLDYVAMNTGFNTKYHADKKHPITLYAHDFDENGRLDLVESEWEGDKCFPIRGKSCSTHAMPMVSEKFPTYHEFALAELSDIYGEDSLSDASKFTVNNLSSVLLINDGNANFEIVELPRLAQISPGFGVAVEDFDGDGNCDIVVAQNFMHPQPETGQMDGGMGLFMRGDGTGNFEPIGPRQSGISIPEQGMGLSVLDFNADQAPDFVVTINDGPLRVYENSWVDHSIRRLAIRIEAGVGNPAGVGCRVRLRNSKDNRTSRVAEINAGGGYLSQSTGELFFAFDEKKPFDIVDVRLPDGTNVSREIRPDQNLLLIQVDKVRQSSDP